jgi:hypothetical protein
MNKSQLPLYYSGHTYEIKTKVVGKMTDELKMKFEEYAEKTYTCWIESALQECK